MAPKQQGLALIGCSSFDNVLNILRVSKKKIGDLISAIEYLDSSSFECSINQLQKGNPFESKYPFYLLIETSSSDEGDAYREALIGLMS